ncbi:MAG: ABC transporter ATP-binding protein [Phycisphaeraceae bacterium]|nr:ABC transporter ATP-binding protein [Phycisphaeraceae bacterium]
MQNAIEQPAALQTEALAVNYGKHPVLHGIDLTVGPGSITGLIGPNGSGKSTLLRAMAGLIRPRGGHTSVQGQRIDQLSHRLLAQTLAFMPQHPIAPPGVTVRELVGYGRAPFNAWYKPVPIGDRTLIESLIQRCDLQPLADRLVHTLSGGERQRAWIAMALAQQPKVLMLDEPVSALDIGHQLEVMDLLTDINREQQTTLIIVLHDLNLAARYCDQTVALLDGDVVAAGPTAQVLNAETIRRCFKVEAQFHKPIDGCSLCSFSRLTTGVSDRH